jgi:hypothetical protein
MFNIIVPFRFDIFVLKRGIARLFDNVGGAKPCAKQFATYIALACLAAVPEGAASQKQGLFSYRGRM